MASGPCTFCHRTASCALSPSDYTITGTWWLSVNHSVSIPVSHPDVLSVIITASHIGESIHPCCVRYPRILFALCGRSCISRPLVLGNWSFVPRRNSHKFTFFLICRTLFPSSVHTASPISFVRWFTWHRGMETRSGHCPTTFRTRANARSVIRRPSPSISVRNGKWI